MTQPAEQLNRTVSLRQAVPDDARLLAQLGARLFEQTYAFANDPNDVRDYIGHAYSIEVVNSELASSDRTTWIAEDAGHAAVGYAAIRRGSTDDGVVGARPAELERIYVDETWHGRGAGHRLMAACNEQARAWHCDVLWLGVWAKNDRAIAFYERAGFRVVGAKTFTLGRTVEQDLVMARSLP
jgi:ribosomal protein S18 acetylase RimI-like enzyme